MVEANAKQPQKKQRTRLLDVPGGAMAPERSSDLDSANAIGLWEHHIALLWDAPTTQPILTENQVHIWAGLLDRTADELAELAVILAVPERERAKRFRFEQHRNRFIAGRALLRGLVANYLHIDPAEVEFAFGPNGKPTLAGRFAESRLQFNLAHCDQLALFAFTRGSSIGVDVERIRVLPDADELVARFFCPREKAAFRRLSEAEKPAAFFNLWTRKEAWLKATGEGIGYSLNRVEVSFLPGKPALLLNLPNAADAVANWKLKELVPAHGFAAAVAFAGQNKQIMCWQLPVNSSSLTTPSPQRFTSPVPLTQEDGNRSQPNNPVTRQSINPPISPPHHHSTTPIAQVQADVNGFQPINPSIHQSINPPVSFRPPIAILGVPFDNVTTTESINLIEQMVASRHPHYLVTANVDFLVQARRDIELRHILFDAHLVLCDGTPLLWASRLLGNPLPERVAGADLVPLLIKVAAQKGYRLFFLGATPESAKQAVANLQRQYPKLIIAGHYSPPFRQLLEMDHEEIKRRINQARPDMLFVSFGCPKQEKWIAMHYRALGVPVVVGVGATIDFLAGQVKRAPVWMQRSGTEWIFRLAQEPRRLFRRYLNDLAVFGVSILRQWWRLQFHARKGTGGNELAKTGSEPRITKAETSNIEHRTPNIDIRASRTNNRMPLVITIPERLDLQAVYESTFLPVDLLQKGRHCLLDMSGVTFIDSSGVGLLIRMQKQLRQLHRELILLAPSQIVTRALTLMQLRDFFASAPNQTAAEQLLSTHAHELSEPVTVSESAFGRPLEWHGEITAANAEGIWHSTLAHFDKAVALDWVIDLSGVRFIDSSGLGVLIKARKHARRNGHPLTFTGLQPAVQNVLRLAHLEEFLLNA